MRESHLLHVFATFDAGGPQVRFATMAGALGAGLRHTIVATDGRYGAGARLDASLRHDLVPPPAGKGSAWYSLALADLIRRLRPDLLLTYNWGAMDAVAGGLLARVCPIVHSEDGVGPDEAGGLKRRRVMARRVLLRGASATIVPSKSLYETAMTRWRLPASSVHFIPNGVSPREPSPELRRNMRRALGLGRDTLAIGSVGRLRPEKNLELLIRAYAAASLDDSRLIIAGDGRCEGELRRLAAGTGMANQIVFVGAVDNPRDYMEAFDLFAMSSATEQMPVALLEAMSAGLPAVCTNVGDTADLLGTAEAPAVISPGDCGAYAAALRTLAGSRELRERLGRANRERCTARYSMAGMVDGYARVYRAALAIQ